VEPAAPAVPTTEVEPAVPGEPATLVRLRRYSFRQYLPRPATFVLPAKPVAPAMFAAPASPAPLQHWPPLQYWPCPQHLAPLQHWPHPPSRHWSNARSAAFGTRACVGGRSALLVDPAMLLDPPVASLFELSMVHATGSNVSAVRVMVNRDLLVIELVPCLKGNQSGSMVEHGSIRQVFRFFPAFLVCSRAVTSQGRRATAVEMVRRRKAGSVSRSWAGQRGCVSRHAHTSTQGPCQVAQLAKRCLLRNQLPKISSKARSKSSSELTARAVWVPALVLQGARAH